MTIRLWLPKSLAALTMIFAVFSSQLAWADDWTVVKLRGNVFALEGQEWVRLARGDVVSDDRHIRSTRSGRAEFVRDRETIRIGGDTQIRIVDRDGRKFTVVQHHFGRVDVQAEKRQVKHFSVVTPHLAAVVKGTQFSVEVTNKHSQVGVTEGLVNTVDQQHKLMVDIGPGQTASVSKGVPLKVGGKGFTQIKSLSGKPLSADDLAALYGADGNSNSGSGSGGVGGLGGALGGAVSGLGGAVSGASGGVGSAVGGGVGDAVEGLGGGLGDALGDVGEGLGGLL